MFCPHFSYLDSWTNYSFYITIIIFSSNFTCCFSYTNINWFSLFFKIFALFAFTWLYHLSHLFGHIVHVSSSPYSANLNITPSSLNIYSYSIISLKVDLLSLSSGYVHPMLTKSKYGIIIPKLLFNVKCHSHFDNTQPPHFNIACSCNDDNESRFLIMNLLLLNRLFLKIVLDSVFPWRRV